MLKTFAAAIVPIAVLGRGTNDGSSFENAAEIDLIPNVLRLFTYNQKGDTDELAGDLFYTATAATAYNMFVEYGFCIRPSTVAPAAVNVAATSWDCMTARTSVDPANKDPVFATTFDLQDRWIAAAPTVLTAVPVTTADADPAATLSWKSNTKLSQKNGCVNGAAATATVAATFWCTSLNANFSKSWVNGTSNQDIQLTADMAGKNYDVFGWTASYSKADYTGTALRPNVSPVRQTRVVFQKYLDDQKAAAEAKALEQKLEAERAAAQAQAAADKLAAQKAAADAIAKAAAERQKLGASSVTTCAAVFFATVYALAF